MKQPLLPEIQTQRLTQHLHAPLHPLESLPPHQGLPVPLLELALAVLVEFQREGFPWAVTLEEAVEGETGVSGGEVRGEFGVVDGGEGGVEGEEGVEFLGMGC